VLQQIFLGKPTHNGFQEQVFSRGVYLDWKLKKRLKEENFEMSVLNSFNEQQVSVIKKALQAKESKEYPGWMTDKLRKENQAKELLQFYKKRKYQPDWKKTIITQVTRTTVRWTVVPLQMMKVW
jgi:NADH dehydrogenase/NADH:ubiquinone oxidoreductase subunit G